MPNARPSALVFSSLCLLATLLGGRSAGAEPAGGSRPVALAEVTSAVAPAAMRLRDPTALIRSDAESELVAIDWARAGVRDRYFVSASLTRLESTESAGRVRSSCTVSAALRDKRGTLVAFVEGKARGEDSAAAAVSIERDVLAAAVRGAIDALPEAIARSR